MAVDKNSKAYNSLRESGYTDEQIMKMHEEWLNGKSANEIINSSKQPERIDANVDQSKYDGTDWKWNITVWPRNANLNYYQYWDDSNPNQQWQKGWMNEKYTWEWVSNTYIEYNPDLTLADLDPNYLYWENARQQNRKEAWYIARRNDQIASALYNEWKVSREDVANFLSQQNEWMNSTEADRLNTIESVWKRLWQIKPEETPTPEEEPQTDFNKDTSGKIYGKTTAEEWNPKQWINTLSDDNSVFNAINTTRVKTTDDMYNVWVDNLAATKYYGTWAYSEQNWRDFSLRYPETAALVDQKVKEMKAQDTVNAVTNGTDLPSNTNTVWAVNNNIADFSNANATSTTSSAQITKNINTMLDNNQTAQTAQELMWTIEWEMATLKNRLKNLREEANSKFKWDAPDYLVNAYMNNKSQEIQNQLSILEDRYNAAYKRYTTEVSNSQWQQEFDLKKQQLELQEKTFNLNKWATEQWIQIDWYKAKWTTSTSKTNPWDTYEVTTLSDEEVWAAVDELLNMLDNWQLGNAQCAAWIQMYYLPKLWISLPNLSSWNNKKKLINEDSNYVPKKWDLILINSWAKLSDWTLAWHIGIVVWVEDWFVKYLDWNGTLDENWVWTEKPAMNKISLWHREIAWFRNVNKSSNSLSSWGWTDYDYEQFEKFRDATTESLRESIANWYWMDVTEFNQVVRNALSNRNDTDEWASDWEETWYDEKLWYNTLHTDIYDQINSNKIDKSDMEWQAKRMWITEKELWRRADNFALAKAKWLIEKEDKKVGYDVNNAALYEQYFDKKTSANKIATLAESAWQSVDDFWDSARAYISDLNAWLINPVEEWAIISTYAYELLNLFADLYNIVDKNENWKVNFTLRPSAYSYDIWNQIRSSLTLDAMLNARENDIWFWQVTEWEWAMLRQSATAIWNAYWTKDKNLDKEFSKMIKALWSKAYWTTNWFSQDTWMDFRDKRKEELWWNPTISNRTKETYTESQKDEFLEELNKWWQDTDDANDWLNQNK